jgi:signal transduction histidine kinase
MKIPTDALVDNSARDASSPSRLDLNIARARIGLSVLAMLSLWVDPSGPGGLFGLTKTAAATLLSHLAYSVILLTVLSRRLAIAHLASISNLLDLFFAAAISFVALGESGPSNVFFVFAVIATAIRPGFKSTLATVIASVVLYEMVIAFSIGLTVATMMRPVYLAILGYLIGFVGQQRAIFEAQVRKLERREQRFTIARSLHDGYVQALAGVNLRLEACCGLLARGRVDDTLGELRDLQQGVAREYDGVRAYVRSLAGLIAEEAPEPSSDANPQCRLQAGFAGKSLTAEHLFQIMLEGLRNARRHGAARSVHINLAGAKDGLLLTIEDDGVGFHDTISKPWAIASRVTELGGHLTVTSRRGATLLTIEVPA